MTDHQFDYIYRAYGLNLGKGTRVKTPEGVGTVTKADSKVWVRLDGSNHADPWHPNDVKVL